MSINDRMPTSDAGKVCCIQCGSSADVVIVPDPFDDTQPDPTPHCADHAQRKVEHGALEYPVDAFYLPYDDEYETVDWSSKNSPKFEIIERENEEAVLEARTNAASVNLDNNR